MNVVQSYPIEDWCPAFHGDALEDCEHGQADVVERGDAVVGALPLLEADGYVGVAGVAAHRRGFLCTGKARTALVSVDYDLV